MLRDRGAVRKRTRYSVDVQGCSGGYFKARVPPGPSGADILIIRLYRLS